MNPKGYRTVIANIAILVAIVPVVASDLIPKEVLAYIIAGEAGLNLYLRFLTTGKVGEKGDSS